MTILQRIRVPIILLMWGGPAFTMANPKVPDNIDGNSSTVSSENTSTAIFAGGCFWCMEKPFDQVDGVISTVSGYTGGQKLNPTYKEVSAGHTGHLEALKVVYYPSKVSYEKLLEVFWHNVDPVDGAGQFCDKGTQYLSAIFVANKQEQVLAQVSLEKLEKSGSLSGEVRPGRIRTKILPAAKFYPAEDYHQNYYQKNPLRYRYYRGGCGRDDRLKQLWGEHK